MKLKTKFTRALNRTEFTWLIAVIILALLRVTRMTAGIDEPTVERLFNFYDIVYPIYNDVRIIPQLHKVIGAR